MLTRLDGWWERAERGIMSPPFGAFGAAFAGDAQQYAAVQGSSYFDPHFYADTYPDLRNAFGYDATALAHHYVDNGSREGRDPGPHFSTHLYYAARPDVASQGFPALAHYELFGKSEGLTPHVFDPATIAADQQAAAQAQAATAKTLADAHANAGKALSAAQAFARSAHADAGRAAAAAQGGVPGAQNLANDAAQAAADADAQVSAIQGAINSGDVGAMNATSDHADAAKADADHATSAANQAQAAAQSYQTQQQLTAQQAQTTAAQASQQQAAAQAEALAAQAATQELQAALAAIQAGHTPVITIAANCPIVGGTWDDVAHSCQLAPLAHTQVETLAPAPAPASGGGGAAAPTPGAATPSAVPVVTTTPLTPAGVAASAAGPGLSGTTVALALGGAAVLYYLMSRRA